MKKQDGGSVDTRLAHQPSRPFTVVIFDDDDIFSARVEGWLGQNPRFVCIGSYRDGKTALAKICSRKPDLALIDSRLPGIKGGAVIRRLKVHSPFTKVLVISGPSYDEAVLDALASGADGFLDKDGLTRRGLLTQLDRLMAGEHPLSDRAGDLLVAEYAKTRAKPEIMAMLTPREQEVADRKCRGLSSEAIARELGVSIWTVRTHERDINSKLHVHNRAELHFKLFGSRRP